SSVETCTSFGSKCSRWMRAASNTRSLNGSANSASTSARVQSERIVPSGAENGAATGLTADIANLSSPPAAGSLIYKKARSVTRAAVDQKSAWQATDGQYLATPAPTQVVCSRCTGAGARRLIQGVSAGFTGPRVHPGGGAHIPPQ